MGISNNQLLIKWVVVGKNGVGLVFVDFDAFVIPDVPIPSFFEMNAEEVEAFIEGSVVGLAGLELEFEGGEGGFGLDIAELPIGWRSGENDEVVGIAGKFEAVIEQAFV